MMGGIWLKLDIHPKMPSSSIFLFLCRCEIADAALVNSANIFQMTKYVEWEPNELLVILKKL